MSIETLIFYIVFFSLSLLLNFYVFIRGWQALSGLAPVRGAYSAAFAFLFISSCVEMFLYRVPNTASLAVIHWAGSFWYGAMFFFFIIAAAVDVTRLGLLAARVRIDRTSPRYAAWKRVLLALAVLAVTAYLAAGYVKARTLHVTSLDLDIAKQVPGRASLNIVMISDIHIGRIIGRERMVKIADAVNSLKPDIILIPGDITDSYIEPFMEENLGSVFSGLKAPLGVWAVTGNHEYYGEIEKTIPALEKCGIRFIRNGVALVENGIYLMGRDDRTGERYYQHPPRPSLEALSKGLRRELPVILMEHNPANIGEASAAGIDLQLSGHTHHGQLVPFNYLTRAIYPLSWGYLKKGPTHYYVSCGVGSWGPPVRMGSVSEVVRIRLRFTGKQAAPPPAPLHAAQPRPGR